MSAKAKLSKRGAFAGEDDDESETGSSARVEKLSVPAFLKLLTSEVGLSTQDALGCTAALVRAGYSTLPRDGSGPLAGVSEISLVAAGVTDPDVRKMLVAFGRSGRGTRTAGTGSGAVADVGSDGGRTGRKRKMQTKDSDLDRPLPTALEDRPALSLEFNEELEDTLLQDRTVVINRAPVMLAWATAVAERLGFTRQEALSIAHTYTNLNATARGVSLGIYSPEKGKERTTVGPSQPYVELLGRQIPVLALQSGEWRGIANGAIAEPEAAFGYIQRSFRQQMSGAMGAFKLLANSIEPDELNRIGYQLYAEFRPEVRNWGEKAQLKLASILDLRRHEDGTLVGAIKAKEDKPGASALKEESSPPTEAIQPMVKIEEGEPPGQSQPLFVPEAKDQVEGSAEAHAPPNKKVKREEDFDDDDGGISDSDLAGLV